MKLKQYNYKLEHNGTTTLLALVATSESEAEDAAFEYADMFFGLSDKRVKEGVSIQKMPRFSLPLSGGAGE